MKLDLGSFDSIKQLVIFSYLPIWNIYLISMTLNRFVADFHNKGLPLNLLINNAGVVCKNFKKSNDGIEYTFAVNHLGHCMI
jgi:NAD(P)-dependent dehydrogenase (short-subunit alcohol dehydrogenase family)